MIIKTGIIPSAAFSIFGIEIYWYAIFITISIALGYIWAWKHDGRYKIKFDDVLTLSLIMIPVGFICARLYYIIFNLSYYMQNPSEILDVRNGGLAIYGGIIGAIGTIAIFCRVKKISFLDLLDYLAPVLPLGQAIGRWGNYVNIEAYGTETNGPIKMEIVEQGVTRFVHPTFLYESICSFVLFFILVYVCRKRKFSGQAAAIYLIGYSFYRFFIEGLRTDSLMLGNIRVSQILSLLIFVPTLIIYILKMKKKPNKEEIRASNTK